MHSLLCSIRESIHFRAFIQLAQFFETLRIVKLNLFTLQVQMSPDREYSSKLRETMQACHIIYAYLSQFFVTAEHDFIQETDIHNVSHMEIYFIILFFFYYGRLHLKSLQNVRQRKSQACDIRTFIAALTLCPDFCYTGIQLRIFQKSLSCRFPCFRLTEHRSLLLFNHSHGPKASSDTFLMGKSSYIFKNQPGCKSFLMINYHILETSHFVWYYTLFSL